MEEAPGGCLRNRRFPGLRLCRVPSAPRLERTLFPGPLQTPGVTPSPRGPHTCGLEAWALWARVRRGLYRVVTLSQVQRDDRRDEWRTSMLPRLEHRQIVEGHQAGLATSQSVTFLLLSMGGGVSTLIDKPLLLLSERKPGAGDTPADEICPPTL